MSLTYTLKKIKMIEFLSEIVYTIDCKALIGTSTCGKSFYQG